MSIPEGWTDDMNIPLPQGRTEDEVVSLVLSLALNGVADEAIETELQVTFTLSPDDAALARDRVFGGVVRGATRNPANRTDPQKDPLAWISFQRAIDDPSIVARLYPQHSRPDDTNVA